MEIEVEKTEKKFVTVCDKCREERYLDTCKRCGKQTCSDCNDVDRICKCGFKYQIYLCKDCYSICKPELDQIQKKLEECTTLEREIKALDKRIKKR